MNYKRRNYLIRKVIKEEVKKYLDEHKKILTEKNGLLPRNIKRDALHDVLGIPDSKKVVDYSVNELYNRAKKAIDDKKIDYATMIRRLNWTAVLNKTKNPEVTKKFREVIKKLHDTFKD